MSESPFPPSFYQSDKNQYKYSKMDESDDNDEIGLCEMNRSNSEGDKPMTIILNNRKKRIEILKRSAIAAFVVITLLFLIILLIYAIYYFEKPRNYKGHKVIKILPVNAEQLKTIIEIEKKFKIDFWNEPYFKEPTEPILLQISPGEMETKIVDEFNDKRINFTVIIEDLHEAIEEEKREHQNIVETDFNFGRYHSYDEIIYYIETDVKSNANVNVEIIGKSSEGREIPVIIINNKKDITKPVILIDSLIHSNEWVTGSTALYIINDLLNNNSVSNYLDRYEFHIIPVFNPDGYAYTWRNDRLWRKTRSRSITSLLCRGSDANRNFDSKFCSNEEETESPCSDSYCGDYAFSEPETAAFRDYVTQLNKTRKIEAYFSLHSFKQLWLFPYAYTDALPSNYIQLKQLSTAAINAIKSVHGIQFKSGIYYNTKYPTSGLSTDWMYESMNVKISFTIELRDNGHNGFLLPKQYIIPTAEETWTGIKAVFDLM